MEKIFLTARWENLVLVTYRVEPSFLLPLLPDGLEPDTIDGKAFISLVAFSFLDTSAKGIKIPFHVNFPEINLRAYVRHKGIRGVVFFREFVPRLLISLGAKIFYNEKYKAVPMKFHIESNGTIFLSHSIKVRSKEYSINLEANKKPYLPPEDSTEHFFKEHNWGFGTNRAGKLLIYKVEHPCWEVFPIIKFEHNFDFKALYGKQWQSLNEDSPYNVTFAKGSPVKVFEGNLVK